MLPLVRDVVYSQGNFKKRLGTYFEWVHQTHVLGFHVRSSGKYIVGREMLAEPRLLLAAHPTRGIDVGAQAAVWDHIREARRKGLGVLLISADLEELIGLSDSLLVILRGEIVARLDPATVTPADLGSYMTGARAGTVA